MFFGLEKTLSVEEKLRRAEEIYQRRRVKENRISLQSSSINIGNKPDLSLFRKTLIKILICIILYFILYFFKNSDYIFSKNIVNKINEVLSYDMNLQKVYNDASKYFENLTNNFSNLNYIKNNEESDRLENKDDQNDSIQVDKLENEDYKKDNIQVDKMESINNDKKENDEKENLENKEENNDVSKEVNKLNEENQVSEENYDTVEKLQNETDIMKKDAKYIKENFELEIPVNGVITSRFGSRTPSNIISSNHAGIDIGVNEGTKIKAVTNGEVTLVSNIGDYRKSCGN